MPFREFSPVGAESNVWTATAEQAPMTPSWVGVALEAAGSRLDDFLYAAAPRAKTPPDAVAEIPAGDMPRPRPASGACPHCSARLSSVERKMERCLSCGHDLRSAATNMEQGARAPLTIGI